MSNLVEKRQEFANKLNELKNERTNEINARVEEFRATLEAEPNEEIDKLLQVISAMDVVIAYEGEKLQKTDGAQVRYTTGAFIPR